MGTSDSLSTMSLCECKILSALKRFVIRAYESQVLTRLTKEKDLFGVALVTPMVSTNFIMMITLSIVTRSWGEMDFNFSSISEKWTGSKDSNMVRKNNSSLGTTVVSTSSAQLYTKSSYFFWQLSPFIDFSSSWSTFLKLGSSNFPFGALWTSLIVQNK